MEAGIGAKRVAWVVIAALGCGFCYSIGFQSGWSDATVKSDHRMDQVTAALQELANEGGSEERDAAAARVAGHTAVAGW